MELAYEVIRDGDPVRRVTSDTDLPSDDGVVDLFTVRQLNDQLRGFGFVYGFFVLHKRDRKVETKMAEKS